MSPAQYRRYWFAFENSYSAYLPWYNLTAYTEDGTFAWRKEVHRSWLERVAWIMHLLESEHVYVSYSEHFYLLRHVKAVVPFHFCTQLEGSVYFKLVFQVLSSCLAYGPICSPLLTDDFKMVPSQAYHLKKVQKYNDV